MNTNIDPFSKNIGQSGITIKEYEILSNDNTVDLLAPEIEKATSDKVKLMKTMTNYDFEMIPFNNDLNKKRIY